MKEDVLKKIHRMGHIGQIITLIVKIILTIGLVLCIAGTVLLYTVPDRFITLDMSGDVALKVDLAKIGKTAKELDITAQTLDFSVLSSKNIKLEPGELSVDGNTVIVRTKGQGSLFNDGGLIGVMISATIKVLLTLICTFMVGRLCKAIRNCESPFDETVINRMRILAYSLIPWMIVDTVENSIGQGLHIDINLAMLLPVFIIFILVRIFRYGAFLQQESDETL